MIHDFEYFAPGTVAEALALLDKCQDEGKVIAGGQSLLILMRQGLVAPKYLIDIKGIAELDYIRTDDEGLKIGTLATHRSIEKSPLINTGYGVLAEMERHVATVQTRNWGTIGGNLCHGDAAGDPMPVLIALNADLRLVGTRGERTIPARAFVVDFFETQLAQDELLAEIQVPRPAAHSGTAYTKFTVIENELGIVGVAVSLVLKSGNEACEDVRIVLGNSGPVPVRATRAEDEVRGQKVTDELLKSAGEIASTETDPISDISASAEYRRELVKVLVPRVAKEAFARAKAN